MSRGCGLVTRCGSPPGVLSLLSCPPVIVSAGVSARHSVAWGDVPTWLLVLVGLLALGAAVLAYWKQSQEVRDQAEQLRLQGEQLADQSASMRSRSG